jgi:hypothetical protein
LAQGCCLRRWSWARGRRIGINDNGLYVKPESHATGKDILSTEDFLAKDWGVFYAPYNNKILQQLQHEEEIKPATKRHTFSLKK